MGPPCRIEQRCRSDSSGVDNDDDADVRGAPLEQCQQLLLRSSRLGEGLWNSPFRGESRAGVQRGASSVSNSTDQIWKARIVLAGTHRPKQARFGGLSEQSL